MALHRLRVLEDFVAFGTACGERWIRLEVRLKMLLHLRQPIKAFATLRTKVPVDFEVDFVLMLLEGVFGFEGSSAAVDAAEIVVLVFVLGEVLVESATGDEGGGAEMAEVVSDLKIEGV
jgi:uncharacterized membrane protein YtjA (UPF0391 family)